MCPARAFYSRIYTHESSAPVSVRLCRPVLASEANNSQRWPIRAITWAGLIVMLGLSRLTQKAHLVLTDARDQFGAKPPAQVKLGWPDGCARQTNQSYLG